MGASDDETCYLLERNAETEEERPWNLVNIVLSESEWRNICFGSKIVLKKKTEAINRN